MAVDLEMHPQDTNIIFVTHGNYNGGDEGVYRSMDGGNNFTLLNNGIPTNYSGKTLLDISPSNPNIIYASVADAFVSLGLYKSDDMGDSWTLMNTEDVAKYQGWYSHDIAINPTDPNTLIYVGVDGFKTTDGGQTLSQKTYWNNWDFGQVPVGGPEGPGNYAHADMHQARYHPLLTNTVFLATDGGIFVSTDNGENFEGRNGHLQTQQFYANFSNSTTDSLFAIGGMQDNATAVYVGDDAWVRVIGGDGMCTAINQQDDNIVYGSYQRLNIIRSNDHGNNFTDYIKPNGVNAETPLFSAPFELAPSDPDIIYGGSQSLFRSENGGNLWNNTFGGQVDNGNSIQTIAISTTNPDLLYISTIPFSLTSEDPPHVMKSVDGGESWTYMTGLT